VSATISSGPALAGLFSGSSPVRVTDALRRRSGQGQFAAAADPGGACVRRIPVVRRSRPRPRLCPRLGPRPRPRSCHFDRREKSSSRALDSRFLPAVEM